MVAGGEVNDGSDDVVGGEGGLRGGVVDGWSSHVDGDNVGFAPIVAEAAGSCCRGRQCWRLRATATAAVDEAWWSAECLIVTQALSPFTIQHSYRARTSADVHAVHVSVFMSLCLHFLCFYVSMSPCLYVSMALSPCLHVSMSP